MSQQPRCVSSVNPSAPPHALSDPQTTTPPTDDNSRLAKSPNSVHNARRPPPRTDQAVAKVFESGERGKHALDPGLRSVWSLVAFDPGCGSADSRSLRTARRLKGE